RCDYARALIDIKAHRDLKDMMVIFVSRWDDNGEVLHTIRGNLKLTKMRVTSDVVSLAHGSSSEEFDSLTNTPQAKTINNLERQILDEKLVFVNSDRKLIKKLDYPVNADSDSEVEEVFNEITRFMTLTSSTINKTVM
ncbi:hypothetical protein Tco_1412578, partial [Tanacetum coccineum]